ncbi:MAG: VWA domain-containing protein [Candidatus Sumerlaeia bacterium]|nr:VWA domain-containing protein [Candidatus Sumerlaeia bacterium]
MTFHVVRPEYLWLLLLLPVFWLAARRLRAIEPARRWMILGLRTLVILLLVLALSKPEIARESHDLTVYFLLDVSDSIPAQKREQALTLVSEFTRGSNKPRNDEAGLIIFGDGASLETLAVNTFEFDGSYRSVVGTARTDISSALRLALSAFPRNRLKRIVLFSDGNENSGSALEIARMARNSAVPIDVVPMRYDQRGDVQIDKLIVPAQTARDAPFDLKVYMSSENQTSTTGRLRVYEDDTLIVDQPVTVEPGRNPPLVLTRRLRDGGFHRYRASVEIPDDPRPQNNRAEAFTHLKAEPRVLYIEGDQMTRNYLAGALRLEEISVDFRGSDSIPQTLEEVQSYDSIILSNVHANQMTIDQMKMIERAVHDLGVGLIMIGGEDSFGAGGYQDSPIEEALPVSMDVKQKKVLPNGALAIVLHTCEIPQGNSWAREISIAALNVLSAQDYFGLLYYGSKPGTGLGGAGGGWGEFWLWEPGLQMTGNKHAMRAKIRGVTPLDMPTFDPTLELAYQGLKDVKTQAKHIIVISDGDPAPPNKDLVNRIRDEGITVSSVIIAPHFGQSEETMRQLAYWGAGEFYYPKTASELPRIFVKEASVVRRSLIFEETFSPVADAPSEMLEGFSALPQLHGYVVTSDKELATIALRTEKDDPLLAHWRYGLGKTVAFTSDARNKWAASWVDWENYSKFWSQLVRWSLRETSSSNFQINTELNAGRGRVVVDAIDPDGSFLNFLEFDAVVLNPSLEPEKVTVRQVGPGRYEGEFEASEVGTYLVRLSSGPEEARQTAVGGAALSYSPEYQAGRSNDEFLDRIATESGGRVAAANYYAFSRDLPATRQPTPIWELLFLLGLLLIPVDIFLRRVYLDPHELWQGFLKGLATAWQTVTFRRPKVTVQRDEAMGSLMAAKQRAHADREQAEEERQARATFRERLDADAEQAPARESVFEAPDAPGPARPRAKHTVSPSDSPDRPPAGGSSLSSLKEAKKRAQERKK